MYLIHVDGSIDMEYIVNWYGIQYITNKFIHLINLELYTKGATAYFSPLSLYRFFVKNKEQTKTRLKKGRNFAFALLLKIKVTRGLSSDRTVAL